MQPGCASYRLTLKWVARKNVNLKMGSLKRQIRLAYQDVKSGCFINIDRNERLLLEEAFRNFVSCGPYNRVNLKVWESDSPALLKTKSKNWDDKTTSQRQYSTSVNSDSDSNLKIKPSAKRPAKLDFAPSSSKVVSDWKENRLEEVTNKLSSLEGQKMCLRNSCKGT